MRTEPCAAQGRMIRSSLSVRPAGSHQNARRPATTIASKTAAAVQRKIRDMVVSTPRVLYCGTLNAKDDERGYRQDDAEHESHQSCGDNIEPDVFDDPDRWLSPPRAGRCQKHDQQGKTPGNCCGFTRTAPRAAWPDATRPCVDVRPPGHQHGDGSERENDWQSSECR